MTFASIIGIIIELLNMVVWLLMALALLTFLYGLMRYMMQAGDDGARAESRQYIVYGIIGLFVMVSMWGLVSVLTSTFVPGSAVGIPDLNI
jgi:hypothetical protein